MSSVRVGGAWPLPESRLSRSAIPVSHWVEMFPWVPPGPPVATRRPWLQPPMGTTGWQ